MNIKKVLGSSFLGGCAVSSVVSCSPATAAYENNFEAEIFQEFVQGGKPLEIIKKSAYSFVDALSDLFKEGGFNDSSKNNFVLSLGRFVEGVVFLNKTGCCSASEIDEFGYEGSEYCKKALPDWFLKLEDQYAVPPEILVERVPEEYREAFKFFIKEMEGVKEKYKPQF